MYTFNFTTKEMKHILASIQFFVISWGVPSVPNAEPKNCKIVNLFDGKRLFVAYPIDLLGTVTIASIRDDASGGSMILQGDARQITTSKLQFSIHGNIIYLSTGFGN